MHLRSFTWFAVAVVLFGVAAAPAVSRAQDTVGSPVQSDFKAAVGLGLVGAEIGAVIPALAGVDATWAYIVFPTIGAAGGAVAGYFAIDKPGHPELSVAALTLGMALVIPALVVTLSLSAYDPDDEVDSAQGQRSGYATARSVPGANARRRSTRSAARQLASAGAGMLRLSEGELALGAPGVGLVPSMQKGQMRVSGMSVALLSGRF